MEKDTGHGDYDYAYDDLYRLKTVDNPELSDEDYTYDGVGNRTTSADTTSDWAYNENNELDGYDEVSYQYDANGNIIEKTASGVTTLFFYNTEDRLVRVEDGDGNVIAAYTYDPFGRRLWKEVGGVKTCYIYADEGLVGETDTAGTVSKTYGYGPGSTWTTDPLFMKQGTEYYFYHNDHLGSPQKLTAINGAVVWSALYTAFGAAQVIPASSVENRLRFAGQYYDSETGLHYNYHRYYDPGTCRYLTPDPIGLAGGINLYAYVQNNPVNFVDPLGLEILGVNTGGSSYFRVGGGASSAILFQSDGKRNRVGFVTTQEVGGGSGSGLFMHAVYGPGDNTIEGYAEASITNSANLSWVSGIWSFGDSPNPYYELGLSLIPSEGVNLSHTTGQVIFTFDYSFGAADTFYGDWFFDHRNDFLSIFNRIFESSGEDLCDVMY